MSMPTRMLCFLTALMPFFYQMPVLKHSLAKCCEDRSAFSKRKGSDGYPTRAAFSIWLSGNRRLQCCSHSGLRADVTPARTFQRGLGMGSNITAHVLATYSWPLWWWKWRKSYCFFQFFIHICDRRGKEPWQDAAVAQTFPFSLALYCHILGRRHS